MNDQPFAWEQSYPPTLSWHTEPKGTTVPSILEEAADRCPNMPALSFGEMTLTYRNWRERAERVAAALLTGGFSPRQPVALLMTNTPYMSIVFFGLLRAGGIGVLLSPLDSLRTHSFKIRDSGARLLFTTNLGGTLPIAVSLLQQGIVDRIIVADDFATGDTNHPRDPIPEIPGVVPMESFLACGQLGCTWPQIDKNDTAIVQYTGGTTGSPKGAILTHGNLAAAVDIYDLWFDAIEDPADDRILCVLPLFHIYGLVAVMLLAIKRRSAIILHMRFDATEVIREIEERRITSFPGVPTMWIAMANHPDFVTSDLSSLRRCSSGGAPLPVEVSRRLEKALDLRLLGGWGMTETSAAGTAIPPYLDARPGSIGIPLPGVELRVVSLDDPTKTLATGEVGELCVRGPNVTSGYWNREGNVASFCDEYLLTGDVGYMEADGFFYIVERKKDMILSGGFNVYPQLIEQAIYEHPDVCECIVIGVPDDYRGESAKAFIVLRDGSPKFSLEDLAKFLSSRLGRHEIPREIEFRSSLPKTPVGKLSRNDLRQQEGEKFPGALSHGG